MTTLEDKILGEKRDYYCSSSEEDDEKEDEGDRESRAEDPPITQEPMPSTSRSQQRWDGVSKNTGPKGVLEDWYLFQKHEEQVRLNKERQLLRMVERASLASLPESNDVPGSETLDELESDDILKDFIKQRMENMLKSQSQRKQFHGLEEVKTADEYLKVVDNTDAEVTIVLHIYENTMPQCLKMNECLLSISDEYRHVRFCKIKGSVAGVSSLFKVEGIPALLVYRGGNLIGNFIRLKEEFGHEFYAGDVENYLIENGILTSAKA